MFSLADIGKPRVDRAGAHTEKLRSLAASEQAFVAERSVDARGFFIGEGELAE